MDLDFSPGILETPSLMTPTITETPLLYYKPSSSLLPDRMATEVTMHGHENNTETRGTGTTDSMSLPSSTRSSSTESNFLDDSLNVTSSGDKLSEIKNDLKKSFTDVRQPTESPFFSKGTLMNSSLARKFMPIVGAISDESSSNVPSTAEVVCEIESLEKYPTKETTGNGTLSLRTETPSIPSEANLSYETSTTDPMGMIVSPKKRFIMRSQSRTDCTSPNPTVPSQSQKSSSSEEENFLEENSFQRAPEPTFEPTPTVNNKRVIPPAATVLIPNEVTSTDPSIGVKRQKTHHASPVIFKRSAPVETSPMNDEVRRNQIRESNREAARRCRERRRNYIETLEASIDEHRNQIKVLNEKLMAVERENSQLRAILSETGLFQRR